jgi:predicted adenylyl cyclase CyaB
MVLLEIETKIKIDDVNKLRKKIKTIAKFDKKEIREDNYYALKRKFRSKSYPNKAFRIRTTGKEYVINFKKWLTSYWDKQIVVKQEFEFKIKDPTPYLELMKDLGFVKWIKKKKITESYLHKKDKRIVIEIHNVHHLGHFMEIEYIAKPSEIKKAKNKLRKILKELEIKQTQIDNTGYTKMLWKKFNFQKQF